ncbi:MAG: class I SAM-dependent methyltransferase, partial [Patescibacteria group bacterium]
MILITKPSKDYELMDSGEGEKLERFGNMVLSRPDPQALWRKRLDAREWEKADARFSRDDKGGDWVMKKDSLIGGKGRWTVEFGELKFWVKPTPFKHVGIFPEQEANWEWLRNRISSAVSLGRDTVFRGGEAERGRAVPARSDTVLNLFAYTGGATLACAQAGAKVVHVDGSKSAIAWARENAELSELKDKPIRWILDDARAFVRRELKRDRKYDGIIMDPPTFGHGPDNEVWEIEEDLLPFIESCFELLSDKPLFFLINGYASGYSAIAYENILVLLVKKYGGKIESGELAIQET